MFNFVICVYRQERRQAQTFQIPLAVSTQAVQISLKTQVKNNFLFTINIRCEINNYLFVFMQNMNIKKQFMAVIE